MHIAIVNLIHAKNRQNNDLSKLPEHKKSDTPGYSYIHPLPRYNLNRASGSIWFHLYRCVPPVLASHN